MNLSRHQLERADLLTTIEQGRRVEVELFQENSRGIRTMGELLKARVFGSTPWAQSLRKRMTNYVRGGGVAHSSAGATARVGGHRSPDPHPWPCEDPYCQSCDDAMKRLLKDCGVLPRKGAKR